MKKVNRNAVTAVAALLLCSCGGGNASDDAETKAQEATFAISEETDAETSAETTVEITVETTVEATSETTAETTAETAEEMTDAEEIEESVEELPENEAVAEAFTKLLSQKLADTSDEYGFKALTDGEAVGMGMLSSVLELADIDLDGVPELFAGTCGTIGAGRFDVLKADGTLLGKNVLCCSDVSMGSIVDGVVYIFSGRNPYPGWVKMVEDTPAVYVSDWINEEEAVNTVDIFNADGTEETIENLSFDEVKKVYSDYLGVDYDALYENMNYPAYQCTSGNLLVPDADNFTDEDIYNCVLSLLEKYDEESVR